MKNEFDATEGKSGGWSIERRLSTYYALMFGAVGLTGPFFSPWMHHLGVSASLTGVAVALPLFAMVLTTVYLGTLADRLSDWRGAIIAADWLVFFCFCWLLVRQEIVDIIVVWAIAGLIIAAKVPIADAATLSLTRRRGSDYSQIRAMGSVGFVLALLLAGKVFEVGGFEWFVPILLVGSLVRALSASLLPRFRAPEQSIQRTKEERLASTATNLGAPAGNIAAVRVGMTQPALVGALKNTGFLLVIVGSALIASSHAYFSTFGMLLWLEEGISTSTTSLLWSVAVIAEIILMWCFKDVSKKASARLCMFIAGLIGIVRWGMSTTEPGMVMLFVLQAMHAFSFGLLFLATVNFISRRVDDSIAARAQALSATFATGLLALALLVSGVVYSKIGADGYWLMCAMCIAGVMLIGLSYKTPLDDELPLT